MRTEGPPYLIGAYLPPERAQDQFPFGLACIRELDLELQASVTFLVGENGTGKSTLMEALAELCGLPPSGGGKNELADRSGPRDHSVLGDALRPRFRERPADAYFFRAEHMAHFAELLDRRRDDPYFGGDPYGRYGGRSLHTRSHGEAFLALFGTRLQEGLYLMDEPESALSPQRQLALLARMSDLVGQGRTQLIVATHSPILLTFPGAEILSLDHGPVRRVGLEETSHYQITRGILEHPDVYWKHLRESDAEEE